MADVTVSGPFFTDRNQIVNRMLVKTREAVAMEGENLVVRNLDDSIRVNQGVYVSSIHTDRKANTNLVTDRGSVYGPWLEGVGSRNRTTRFKGYFSFRRATQELDKNSAEIANTTAAPFIKELNE